MTTASQIEAPVETTVEFTFRGATITLTGTPAAIAETRHRIGDYDCPSWCSRTDHDGDVVDAANPPRHYGPDLADYLMINAVGSGQPFAEIVEDITFAGEQGITRLRQLSAGALVVAEWIEAHQ